MICLAQLSVIFSLRKSDIAPDGRSDILFAFVVSNARSAYHCRRQYHARSAYHSPQANRVGAPALSQVRHAVALFCVLDLGHPLDDQISCRGDILLLLLARDLALDGHGALVAKLVQALDNGGNVGDALADGCLNAVLGRVGGIEAVLDVGIENVLAEHLKSGSYVEIKRAMSWRDWN